jgi:dTDP-4-dehydrorhamnose reductase
VDLRAFTAWSLFGATDWDSLCTIRRNHYEPGVYDVRGPKPRATALAKIFKQISESQSVSHPFLDTPGWWRRSERHSHGFCISPCGSVQRVHPSTLVVHSTGAATRAAASALLVINPTGMIGGGLRRECQGRALRFHEVELGDHAKSSDLLRTVRELQPWAIVNASEHPDPLLCAMIARICKQRRLASVAFSSYLVFDGGKPGPYVESDPIHPRDPAGARYAIAEEEIFAGYPETLLLRTGELLGRQDGADESHSTGQSIRSRLLPDELSITYIPDLVRNALDLLIDGEIGIWHLANPGTVTSEELAELQPSAAHQTLAIDHHATRPASLVLASEKAWLLPTAHSAIERYLDSLPEGLEEAAA